MHLCPDQLVLIYIENVPYEFKSHEIDEKINEMKKIQTHIHRQNRSDKIVTRASEIVNENIWTDNEIRKSKIKEKEAYWHREKKKKKESESNCFDC